MISMSASTKGYAPRCPEGYIYYKHLSYKHLSRRCQLGFPLGARWVIGFTNLTLLSSRLTGLVNIFVRACVRLHLPFHNQPCA